MVAHEMYTSQNGCPDTGVFFENMEPRDVLSAMHILKAKLNQWHNNSTYHEASSSIVQCITHNINISFDPGIGLHMT
jgi:hypothetical protein